ncbi:MAG TPA: potassium transporter TrkG [Candidatus Babeliales bacterium]|nr:potassium transporter TrkG [Candidatus Babeliales bacterium]
MSSKKRMHLSPPLIIFLSVVGTIFIGTALLALPWSQEHPISYIDLLFTATSMTCVTGLTTVPLSSFTPFGKAIILILIQIGGLGLVTLTMSLMSLFMNFGFATQLMAGKIFELESWHNIKRLILFILGITLFFELIGTGVIYWVLYDHYPHYDALFLSAFHAISSFCNGGISLIDKNRLLDIASPIMIVTTTILILSGGLGFITWKEILLYIRSIRRKKKYHFSLSSKIVLYATGLFIALSTIIIFALEYSHSFAHMSLPQALLNSFFYAVSFRGTGFLTVDIHSFHNATLFLALITAFIGSSPVSTGSGIKLTTLAIFFATIKSAISERNAVEIKERSIEKDQVNKAFAIVSLSLIWITLTIFCLLIIESHHNFFPLFFETISAFTTLGLSTGITASLSTLGKVIITISMLIGRIGSLTLVLALRSFTLKRTHDVTEFSYPKERVILT